MPAGIRSERLEMRAVYGVGVSYSALLYSRRGLSVVVLFLQLPSF